MTDSQIQQLVQTAVQTAVQHAIGQLRAEIQQAISDYDKKPVKPHQHNRYDAPQVESSDLLGFDVDTAVPTQKDEDGKLRVYTDGVNYYLYIRIKQGWRKVQLT